MQQGLPHALHLQVARDVAAQVEFESKT